MYDNARILILLMLSCLLYSANCQDNVNYDYYDYDVEAPTETKDTSKKTTLIEIPLLEFPVKESILESQPEVDTEAPIIETTTAKSKSKPGRKRKLVQPRRRPSSKLSRSRPVSVERPTKKVAEPEVEEVNSVAEEVKKSNAQNTRGRSSAGSSRFNRNRSRPGSSSSSPADNDDSEISVTTESSRRVPGRRRGGGRVRPSSKGPSSQQHKEESDDSTASKTSSSTGRKSFRPSSGDSVTSTEAPETTKASTHRFRGSSRPSSSRSRLNGRRSFEQSPSTVNDGPQEETVDGEEAKASPPESSSNSRFGRRG